MASSMRFGIIGSAFMPISDLFPKAGITFWDVAHETNGGLICDGYTRATGKIAMAIAQNGPGVTGFVTPIKTAYWNHTPMLLVTPQAANKTIGQGGFQEVEQMALFKDMVCYQEEVRDASRMAEVLNRVIEKAIRGSAPAQINVPRDYWTQVIDIELPQIVRLERPAGGAAAIAEAAKLLSEAKFPVILSGAGVVIGNAIPECQALAERLDAPVASGYQHNDSFPGSHPLAAGPLGYNGSKAAMELIAQGRRGAGPGHPAQSLLDPAGLRHRLLAQGRQHHPGRHQFRPHRLDQEGHRAGSAATPRLVAQQILAQLAPTAGDARPGGAQGHHPSGQVGVAAGPQQHGPRRGRSRHHLERRFSAPGMRTCMSPRMAWRAIQAGLPKDAIISSDIGNNCAIGNAYPTFEEGRKYLAPGLFGPCGYGFPSILGAKIGCPDVPVVGFAGDGAFGISMNEMTSCGRDDWPAITMVIFRNYQWGAEKRNTTLWYDNNFVGTELNPELSYAKVAEGCGLKGVR